MSEWLQVIGVEMSPPRAFLMDHLLTLYCSSETMRRWVGVPRELESCPRKGRRRGPAEMIREANGRLNCELLFIKMW